MHSITKHVFVDFENVCEVDTTLLENKNVSFTLLLGAQQTKLDVGLVQQLLLHAASVQLVRITSRGQNALDFALAYYLGQAVAAAPQSAFHIISKDTGFDPLIEHLVSKQIQISRHTDFALLTAPSVRQPASPKIKASPKPKTPATGARTAVAIREEVTTQALTLLRKISASRPKSRKTLLSFLTSHLGPDMTETGAARLIDRLSQAGALAIDAKDAVTYNLEQGNV
jgi:hypothetical protein